jgi:hypothetical protein
VKKDYKHKMLNPEDGAPSLSVTCIQECNVPGVGTWKAGDVITDPVVIGKISGSPYFKPTQEVK